MASTAAKTKLSLAQRDYVAGYIFVAPILLLMLVWFYYPALQSLLYSFQEINFLKMADARYIGLGNFQKLFADPAFWQAAKNTVIITAVSVPALVIFGFLVAYNIEAVMRGKAAYRTLYYIPAVTSAVALTISVMYLFIERGAIPTLLNRVFGIPDVTWPADTRTALAFVCILVIWKNLGFFVVLFITGLQAISNEIIEASKVDGATGLQRMWYITIPQLRPTTSLVVILSIIWCMQCFDEPYTLARSGGVVGSPAGTTSTLVTFFYSQNFRYFNPGYGSAAAFVIFAVLMLVSVIQRAYSGRSQDHA
ncbi:carbohydrate ABC transporter permease [Cohnella sp. GbtcB17]|uniref:carbohydrate ABC transporter permease n=1 Tax=Cohnella sp. GbtcB17 TaxID=2824762 RepID=UPI001C2FAA5D|nr:sugar ABC transporter permease [Cohnella sp. GbtcB17]